MASPSGSAASYRGATCTPGEPPSTGRKGKFVTLATNFVTGKGCKTTGGPRRRNNKDSGHPRPNSASAGGPTTLSSAVRMGRGACPPTYLGLGFAVSRPLWMGRQARFRRPQGAAVRARGMDGRPIRKDASASGWRSGARPSSSHRVRCGATAPEFEHLTATLVAAIEACS